MTKEVKYYFLYISGDLILLNGKISIWDSQY